MMLQHFRIFGIWLWDLEAETIWMNHRFLLLKLNCVCFCSGEKVEVGRYMWSNPEKCYSPVQFFTVNGTNVRLTYQFETIVGICGNHWSRGHSSI
jgi:hypothetical protein